MGIRNPNKFEEEAREAVKMDDVAKLINTLKQAETLVRIVEKFIGRQAHDQDIFNAVDPRNLGSKGKSQEIQK